MPRPLLVPLDGSELGEAALPWAVTLARSHDVPVVLVRVIGRPPYRAPAEAYAQFLTATRTPIEADLERVRQRLAAAGRRVETAIRDGDAAESILNLADEIGAFAIVMAFHGRGGLTRLVLGSVAERVLEQATVPVLLVRAGAARNQTRPALSRLPVPLDGSPLAEQALSSAQDLAADGVTLLLLQIVPPVQRFLAGGRRVATVDRAATRRAVTEAEEYLDRLARAVDSARVSTRTAVRTGAAGSEILSAARNEAVDLVVMGTHGRTGPARWLMGSVADEVVRRGEQPVFLVSTRTMAARVLGPLVERDVMSADPACLRDDEPLSAALRKLLRRRASGAPVVDAAGKLVGIVSEHDILARHAGLIDGVAVVAADSGPDLETGTVGQIMSSPAVAIDEAAPLRKATGLLVERRLRLLPVTRGGKPVGTLTRADVLNVLATRRQAAASPTRVVPGAEAVVPASAI